MVEESRREAEAVRIRADMLEAEMNAYRQNIEAQLEASQSLLPMLREAVSVV